MKHWNNLPYSADAKSKYLNDDEADLSDDLLLEGVETQTTRSIQNLSENMKANPLRKTKRDQLLTGKNMQSGFRELSPLNSLRYAKSGNFIIEEIKENSLLIDDTISPKLSRKEDISRLLKQAVFQRKKSSIPNDKHKANSVKIDNSPLKNSKEDQKDFDNYFITVGELEWWDLQN